MICLTKVVKFCWTVSNEKTLSETNAYFEELSPDNYEEGIKW